MTSHPLFRQEALDHAARRLDGEVLLPAPLTTWSALAVIIAVLGLAACVAATANYTRKESVRGLLAPESGIARAVTGGDGFVATLMVSEGDHVEAGLPLARIGTPDQIRIARDQSQGLTLSHDADDSIVHAPVDGRVEHIRVQVGQYISHGSTVAVLAAGDDLVAELLLPSRVVGLVEIGQRISLTYDAFPFPREGIQEGVVIHISKAPLAPQVSDKDAIRLAEPVYRARVRLPAQRVSVRGRTLSLRPGMLLTAEIAAGRQIVLESLYQALR